MVWSVLTTAKKRIQGEVDEESLDPPGLPEEAELEDSYANGRAASPCGLWLLSLEDGPISQSV